MPILFAPKTPGAPKKPRKGRAPTDGLAGLYTDREESKQAPAAFGAAAPPNGQTGPVAGAPPPAPPTTPPAAPPAPPVAPPAPPPVPGNYIPRVGAAGGLSELAIRPRTMAEYEVLRNKPDQPPPHPDMVREGLGKMAADRMGSRKAPWEGNDRLFAPVSTGAARPADLPRGWVTPGDLPNIGNRLEALANSVGAQGKTYDDGGPIENRTPGARAKAGSIPIPGVDVHAMREKRDDFSQEQLGRDRLAAMNKARRMQGLPPLTELPRPDQDPNAAPGGIVGFTPVGG